MKVLIIASYLPYPLHSGGHVRLYNLIKELTLQHEITLVCEKRSQQTQEDITEVEKICKKVITVDRKKQWSIENILKSSTSSHSFLVTGHTSEDFKQKIQETLAYDPFDVIHVETFYVMQNLPKTDLPIVLVEHNIEYQVYKKFMMGAPMFLRPLLQIDIAKIKREEEHFWKKANVLVAVSKEDQKVMQQVGCDPQLVPNGVNIDQFSFTSFEERAKASQNRERKILLIGDFKWIQNRDSLTFIIKEIWPLIKKKDLNLKLWIVGRQIPKAMRSLTTDPDVLFDEESSAKPTPGLFQEAAVLLAPIRIGGGTSYKILEAMSCGTPVVTMQMSADAIGAADGRDIMVGQSADELAEKTKKLLENESFYKSIAKHGRELIEKNFTWEKIGKDLEEVYKRAMIY